MPSSPFREMSVSRRATMISGAVHRETRDFHVAVGRFDELVGSAISLIGKSIAYPARLALVRRPARGALPIKNRESRCFRGGWAVPFLPCSPFAHLPHDAKNGRVTLLVARAP